MKKRILHLCIALTLLPGIFFVPGQTLAQENLAGVHIVLPGEDLDAKVKAFDLRYYTDIDQNLPGETFLIMPTPDTQIGIFDVELDEKGALHLGKRKWFMNINVPNIGLVLHHPVPEGIPNLAVCLTGNDRQRICWVPRYNGEYGSLELDPGFYPIREKDEDTTKQQYSRPTKPLLSGPELIDQPLFFVERVKDAGHLARLAAEFKFVPKGEFNPDLPHHVLLAPLVVPATVKLHIMEYKGGDGDLNPNPIKEITLENSDTAIFSLNLDDLKNPNNPDEEKQYVFVATDIDGSQHLWVMEIDSASELLNGYGLGPLEKFIRWPSEWQIR